MLRIIVSCALYGATRYDAHLVAEELRVVLRVEVRLGRLGRVELETLADTLAEDVEGGVGLHNLGHRLLDERLHAGSPVAVGRVQVVGKVDTDEDSGRRGVDGHRVGRVVEELQEGRTSAPNS